MSVAVGQSDLPLEVLLEAAVVAVGSWHAQVL